MPYSKKYNCVFYHIPKVAGTSIETALGCRKEYSGGGGGMSKNLSELKGGMIHHMPDRVLRRLSETMKGGPFLTETNYGDDVFKFTFVRNPWDKLVSEYLYKPHPSFWSTDFEHYLNVWLPYIKRNYVDVEASADHILLKRGDLHHLPQCEFLKTDAVDFVGRFENIKKDWVTVCERLGLHKPLKLPHSRKKKKRKHYSEYYTPWTRQLVKEVYARDIEMLGYTFEEA
tara:strand:+ start:8480 stop:9163 length:684 start_codon:yes stop_codon:yes gene_type:complete